MITATIVDMIAATLLDVITVEILDAEMRPISTNLQDFKADFVQAIREAKRLSNSGTSCCIQVTLINDGQVAYYGTLGCSLRPQWYGKPPTCGLSHPAPLRQANRPGTAHP
jgi:23S rRNA C2498 (ribose-2'-O)-methylase RlmM